jgi:hypothetical protein
MVKLGCVTIHGDEVLLGLAGPNELFGESLAGPEAYEAATLSDCDLLCLSHAELEKHPCLSPVLLEAVSQRQRQSQAMLALMGLRRVEDRIRGFLELLALEYGVSCPQGLRLTPKLTHQEIASALGTTRVTVTRIIGNIGDEGNAIRETGGTELYSLPFTPPEPLGGDDYNGKFVVYEWECPDGSKQRSDPCNNPQPKDEALSYSQPVNVTVNIEWSYQLNSTPCNLIDPPSSLNDSGTASAVLDLAVKLYMATIAVSESELPLPATGGPAPPHAPSGAECDSFGIYSRNASLFWEDNTGSINQVGVYGPSPTLLADSSYEGFHTSRITSVILNESVEGIGDAGDDITELGRASNTPYPIS